MPVVEGPTRSVAYPRLTFGRVRRPAFKRQSDRGTESLRNGGERAGTVMRHVLTADMGGGAGPEARGARDGRRALSVRAAWRRDLAAALGAMGSLATEVIGLRPAAWPMRARHRLDRGQPAVPGLRHDDPATSKRHRATPAGGTRAAADARTSSPSATRPRRGRPQWSSSTAPARSPAMARAKSTASVAGAAPVRPAGAAAHDRNEIRRGRGRAVPRRAPNGERRRCPASRALSRSRARRSRAGTATPGRSWSTAACSPARSIG